MFRYFLTNNTFSCLVFQLVEASYVFRFNWTLDLYVLEKFCNGGIAKL